MKKNLFDVLTERHEMVKQAFVGSAIKKGISTIKKNPLKSLAAVGGAAEVGTAVVGGSRAATATKTMGSNVGRRGPIGVTV